MTREHWKTVVLAVIAAALVFIDILPLRTVSIHVEVSPPGGHVAEKPPVPEAATATALATGMLALILLIVTICLIVWVIRRCLRHLADAKKPNLADVF